MCYKLNAVFFFVFLSFLVILENHFSFNFEIFPKIINLTKLVLFPSFSDSPNLENDCLF